jgi:hypothetical protein
MAPAYEAIGWEKRGTAAQHPADCYPAFQPKKALVHSFIEWNA